MNRWRMGTWLALSLVLAMLVVSVSGCAKKPEEHVDPNKTHLMIAVAGDLDGTDVQQVFTSNVVQQLITPPPVAFDLLQENLVPQIAEAISFSADGKSIILDFPADLKFPDGRQATGADIEASIERYIEISPYTDDWGELDNIVVDGQKVTLTFNDPPAYFFAVLSTTYSGIIDVQEAERLGDEAFNREAAGIGPYTLTEWVQGSHFAFARNDHYVDYKPFVQNKGPFHMDQVTVRVIPDAFTRVSELEAGRVDVVYGISPEHKSRVEGNAALDLISYPAAGQVYLRLNNQKAPFTDIKFREAINYAINKAEIKTALDDSIEPVYGLLSPAQLAYNQAVEDELKALRQYDIDRAKQLLAELGYTPNASGMLEKDGQPLKLLMISTNNMQTHKLAGPVVQQQLKAVGIEIELQEHGRPYVRELVADGGYDLAFQQWSWNDPDIWFYSFHSSNSNPVWTSPQLDAILESGRTIIDIGERSAKYGELSRAVADTLPMVPLFYAIEYIGVRKALTGLHISVDGVVHYNDAKK